MFSLVHGQGAILLYLNSLHVLILTYAYTYFPLYELLIGYLKKIRCLHYAKHYKLK